MKIRNSLIIFLITLLVVLNSRFCVLSQATETNIQVMNLTENQNKLLDTSEVDIPNFSLYEFGSSKCKQCKLMKEVILKLKETLKGKVNVQIFDINENKEMAKKFKIMLIPCQVFLDSNENELFRHEGFYSEEEIINKLKELGVKL